MNEAQKYDGALLAELHPYAQSILEIIPLGDSCLCFRIRHTCGHPVYWRILDAESNDDFRQRLIPEIQAKCQSVCPLKNCQEASE